MQVTYAKVAGMRARGACDRPEGGSDRRGPPSLYASSGQTMKQRIKTLCAGGLLALAPFGTATAGPLEDGQAAFQKGDFATALQIFRPLAEQGNAEAQYNLDRSYLNLGVADQALVWARKAADQGYAPAQVELGMWYDMGIVVPQDYAQAAAWWRKAAEQGFASGQFFLGDLYEKGQGVPQDYVQAHMWFNLAASRAPDAATVESRDRVAAKMTPAQIAEAQRMTREWKPTK